MEVNLELNFKKYRK